MFVLPYGHAGIADLHCGGFGRRFASVATSFWYFSLPFVNKGAMNPFLFLPLQYYLLPWP